MPSLTARPHTLVRALAAAALLVGSASTLHAQGKMRFDSTGSITGFKASDLAPSGADVGASYATLLSGQPALPGMNRGLIVYCVDISNDALYGQIWDAWMTPLGGTPSGTTPDLSLTRQGAIDPNALVHYRKAAWLVGQYASHPGQEAGIQGAIWLQFKSSLFPFGASPTEQVAVDTWLGKADAFAASAQYDTYNYSRFVVITDTAAVGRPYGGAQEFVTMSTTTPEPATEALFATGLVTLGGLSWRRRRTRASA